MKKVFINVEDYEINIAVVEEEKLINFYVERVVYAKQGNIYKGRVSKIIPNMNFVFVDINDDKPGFLSEKEYFNFSMEDFSDFFDDVKDIGIQAFDSEIKFFEKGEEVLVQVVKEAYKTKGARLTTNIMFPGNYIVFFPFLKHIAVSKKIQEQDERERLKNIVQNIREKIGNNFGVIIRTNAKGVGEDELYKEINYYYNLSNEVIKDSQIKKAPCLIYEAPDIFKKFIREYMDEEVKEIIVDSEMVYEKIMSELKELKKEVNLKYYNGIKPLFEYFEIDKQIKMLFNNIVSIKKGGYIKIDHTEALTVVDVNSGKFKGDTDIENSIYLTNENAAKEIARQIILRNIGGLIVVDFIDMKNEENKVKIKEIMDKELSKSKLFFKTSPISEFGLMEIIRKRNEKRINEVYFTNCESCKGTGLTFSKESICINYLKEIKYKCKQAIEKEVFIELPEEIKIKLEEEYKNFINRYEKIYNKKVILKSIEKQ